VRPEVETRYGRLRGCESRGIRVFRGIPFARPPVGRLRFRAPEPPEPWAGTRSALRPGPAAIQASLPVLRSLPLAAGRRQSEDCLYLNVFTPGLDGARRPVLVWIHGGGFLIGSGSTALYDGRRLARAGDVVVVTLNYRLGALGFLHLDGLSESLTGVSNAGVRDQIAALEWVREHADRFGGDPGNVTLFGQSAGAMSIAALLGAPRARRLFRRAILQSGAAEQVPGRARADEVARVFLEEVGGPALHPDPLGRIPVARIVAAQGATTRRLADLANLMAFTPCVDGDLIPEPPLEALRRGALADREILIGTTLDEWKLFALFESRLPALRERGLVGRLAQILPRVAAGAPAAPLAARQYREAVRARGGRTTPFEVWNAFQSARVFHVPAAELAEAHAAGGGRAWTYLFTWRPPALRRPLGAFHAIDVPFVFGLAESPIARPLTGLAGSAPRLAQRMQRAWSEFARSGSPACDLLPGWEPYRAEDRSTMLLGERCALAREPLEAERSLWQRWRAPAAPGYPAASAASSRK
jgi:para-nitrobenzyl esterase